MPSVCYRRFPVAGPVLVALSWQAPRPPQAVGPLAPVWAVFLELPSCPILMRPLNPRPPALARESVRFFCRFFFEPREAFGVCGIAGWGGGGTKH